ncbi:tetratricopeptide repeat protein [Actinokineospora pegani]|uniref:tetratricopeptide repeat protein n=1 Tax=Actinokineospora pegani TaxID=2654637 RepID=UPI0012EAB6BE|nr:tetratricopeptide repeat protein [Actinokineospora pegani]
MREHLWLPGTPRPPASAHSPVLAWIDAHRHHRGPYTLVGTLLREIVDDALERCPGIGERANVAILTCAPEFAGAVPPMETPLQLMSKAGERTRFQARLHTLRISHGVVDLLAEYLAARADGPMALVVANADSADPTDQEFLAVALRRLDPAVLRLVVGAAGSVVDPPGPVAASLPDALAEYATRLEGTESTVVATSFVDSDGTVADPAYDALPPGERAALHDAHAARLTAVGEFSLSLGAIPFHLERGSDPAAAAVALRQAQVHCRNLGMYHAAADLGERGRALVDRADDPELWWEFTGGMTTALSSAGRADEAETVYGEVRASSTDPAVHMKVAYGMAMLYARHHAPERHDYQVARSWLNLAIALATRLEDPKERTYFTVFNGNGLALVAIRQGRVDEAIALLDQGMERLDRELDPGERAMHRAGLRYNRARVHTMLGRLDEALVEYTAVMAIDEGFADHHFNRAAVLLRMGRPAEAIADYEEVIRLSPPFPEVFYNCADARLELGDLDGALADLRRVVDLDPDHADARANLAGLLCELDLPEQAWTEIAAGLRVAPEHPHLLCAKARVLIERGETDGARAAANAALSADPGMAQAWALLGSLDYESGQVGTAIEHLDRAAELDDSPQIRFNRAVAHESAGDLGQAIVDYEAVLAAVEDDDARTRLESCRRALAR